MATTPAMPDEDEDEGIDSVKLAKELTGLSDTVRLQTVERHQANKAIVASQKTLLARLDAQDGAMAIIASTVQRIEARIMGDMGSAGLVTEMAAIRTELAVQSQEFSKLKVYVNYVVAFLGTITGLAGILTWLQQHFNWPFGGGGKP